MFLFQSIIFLFLLFALFCRPCAPTVNTYTVLQQSLLNHNKCLFLSGNHVEEGPQTLSSDTTSRTACAAGQTYFSPYMHSARSWKLTSCPRTLSGSWSCHSGGAVLEPPTPPSSNPAPTEPGDKNNRSCVCMCVCDASAVPPCQAHSNNRGGSLLL